MDRDTVIEGLTILADRKNDDACEGLKCCKIAEDALFLLKGQEAVEPITEHHLFLCPVCKNTLFREQKFCHECGKRIEWEGR